MRRKTLIPISAIRVDRFPMNPKTLELIDYMRDFNRVPPIKVARLLNGMYEVRDGRHRLLAHKMLGRTHIMAVVSDKVMQVK